MDVIAATLTIQAAPELLRVIERMADALEDLVRLQSDALHARAVPETTSSAGAPASAQAAPAGDSRAPDVSSATAQPARVPNEPTAPAAASSDGGKVWTEARNTYLRNARRAGFTRRATFDALQKMPGLPIASPGAVAAQANKLARQAPRETAPSPATVAAPTPRLPVPSLDAVEADVDQIRSWALQRGMTFLARFQDMDLQKINLRRSALGLPPFKLIRRQRQAA